MKTTRYLEEQVLVRRPYIEIEWCRRALEQYMNREVQADRRICYWIFIPELEKCLSVITLEDGETIHNAFPSKTFREEV